MRELGDFIGSDRAKATEEQRTIDEEDNFILLQCTKESIEQGDHQAYALNGLLTKVPGMGNVYNGCYGEESEEGWKTAACGC